MVLEEVEKREISLFLFYNIFFFFSFEALAPHAEGVDPLSTAWIINRIKKNKIEGKKVEKKKGGLDILRDEDNNDVIDIGKEDLVIVIIIVILIIFLI
jgi:hypothetical protein